MTKLAPNLTLQEQEKLLGPQRQATRYPVFKNVKATWSFNYATEEKKRFKALPLWVPSPALSEATINLYLKQVYFLWPKRTGMNEEIALRLLMASQYDPALALACLETSQMSASYEIV